MDPTEIIAVPIPPLRLETFVGFSVLIMFVVSVSWWELAALWRELIVLTVATVSILAISILCGAHPQTNLLYTVLASFYVASLLSLYPPVFNDSVGWNLQQLFTSRPAARLGDDIVGACRFYVTLLVMVPFQILNILDSGLQVQRWPLPMLLGSTVGWGTGSILGLLWALYTNCNASDAKAGNERCMQDNQKKDRYI
jgi:hypothetical protein